MAHIVPTEQPARYIVSQADEIILDGVTELGQETGVNNELETITAEGDLEFLAIVGNAGDYKPLPDSGWLEANEIYSYSCEFVIVRQSHNRTIYAPAETPALFSVYRENVDGIDWIANEPVTVGTVRLYEEIKYSCIQSHTTQVDWTPPTTASLWAVVDETPVEEYSEWVQPTGAHDAYAIGDKCTFNSHLWESMINANVWSPSVYPAGWNDLGLW